MRRALRGLLLPAFATLVALAVLISLGNWQLRRLAWKEDLIARVTERLSLPPIEPGAEAFSDPNAFLAENEFRPVRLTGRYDAGGEVEVFTSLSEPKGRHGGPGVFMLTPFRPVAGDAIVFVNRGFVPQSEKGKETPPAEGVVTIEGPLRAPEKGSWLTPDANPGERLFFARDPAAIAAAMGIEGWVVPFFVDLGAAETPPSGLPQAGETRTVFANSHFEYALTWYGLAAGLAAVFAAFAYGRIRGGRGPFDQVEPGPGNRPLKETEREGRLTEGGEAP
jgi:surfeit locus 1 family protein